MKASLLMRQIGVILLVYVIIVLNTYLAMLSISADFDGKDHSRIVVMQSYTTNVPLPNIRIDRLKLAIDSLQKYGIVRDFEIAYDTSFVKNLLLKRGKAFADTLDKWNAGLSEMERVRTPGLPFLVLDFWVLYFGMVVNFITMHGIVLYLVNILVSPLIYFLVIIFSIWLSFEIIKRRFVFARSELLQGEIDVCLKSTPSEYQENIAAIDKNYAAIKGLGILQSFIKRFNQNKRVITAKLLDSLLVEDDIENEEFLKKTEMMNAWIIRMGILGTLLGIMLAFFEVAKAVPLVTSDNIPPEFKQRIREALTGNAVSVITSIAAHLTTILFEIFLLRKLSTSPNKAWIFNKKDELNYHLKNGVSGVNPDFISEFNNELKITIDELKRFKEFIKKSTDDSIIYMPDISENIKNEAGLISKTFKTINDNIKPIVEKSAKSAEHMVSIEEDLLIINKSVSKTATAINGIREFAEHIDSKVVIEIKKVIEDLKTKLIKILQ